MSNQKKFNKLLRERLNSLYGIHSPSLTWQTSFDKLHNEEPQKEDTQTKDEWIWINGYKGTDKDMKCRDFQYELNKQFDMPEDEDVSLCESGFHLCRDLDDVFNYYEATDGNRYFHVRALVRKEDFENYGKYYGLVLLYMPTNKIVAKSIEFLSEVSRDELDTALADKYGEEFITLPKKYQEKVPEISIAEATKLVDVDGLIKAGYPSELAEYIVKYDVNNNHITKAYELAAMTTITLDTKMVLIFS